MPPNTNPADIASKKKTFYKDDIVRTAIAIVDRERFNWEDAVTFITPRVGFRMRELIRICRKNFWGVFDEPIDKNTQREKIWINLAMATVDTWVKNIDLDTKDINFVARTPKGYEITEITRLKVKDYLDRIYFGETLDSQERQVLIDGTAVWKTWQEYDGDKIVMKRRSVDLLNFYIDPTEDNVQTAYRVTERGIVLPSQIEAMTGWHDTEDLPGSQVLNRVDGSRRNNFGTKMTGEYRDVWEMWGKIPKWLVEGDKDAEDANDEIDGHIVVSGLEAPQPTLHLVEKNTRKDKFGNVIKPYEEWRACKMEGRWYGLGVIERILALQEYLNTIMNIRITRSYVSQLGLFKVKKGKGITSAMLNRLATNGAVQVTDMDDIEQFEMNEASEASYKDEDVIKYWAQQITSAFPISSGDTMPASTTATAAAVANSNAKSSYSMFKEEAGIFLERWIDRHALPIIAKTMQVGDIFQLSTDDESFKKLVEKIALNKAMQHLEKTKYVPTEQELLAEIQRETERLQSLPQLFVENVQEAIISELDTRVHVTNEDLDTNATITNLINMLQVAPEYRDSMVKDIYDLMGLQLPPKPQQQMQPPQQAMPGQGGMLPQQPMRPANATNAAQRSMAIGGPGR